MSALVAAYQRDQGVLAWWVGQTPCPSWTPWQLVGWLNANESAEIPKQLPEWMMGRLNEAFHGAEGLRP